jgi:hypothetical protein
MRFVGDAVPVLIPATDVEAGTGGATMASIAGIELAVLQPFKHRVLTSLNDYYSALFGTILPSLIENMSALMQCIALTRTLQELAATFSWEVALQYLNRHLPRARPYVAIAAARSQHAIDVVRVARRCQRVCIASSVLVDESCLCEGVDR